MVVYLVVNSSGRKPKTTDVTWAPFAFVFSVEWDRATDNLNKRTKSNLGQELSPRNSSEGPRPPTHTIPEVFEELSEC